MENISEPVGKVAEVRVVGGELMSGRDRGRKEDSKVGGAQVEETGL